MLKFNSATNQYSQENIVALPSAHILPSPSPCFTPQQQRASTLCDFQSIYLEMQYNDVTRQDLTGILLDDVYPMSVEKRYYSPGRESSRMYTSREVAERDQER